VLLNPESGPGRTTVEALRDQFPDQEVLECEGDDIPREVRRAVESGADFVAVAGGDGSIRCAAAALAGTGIPLVPVPAGTRNHFAQEVGITSVADAGSAVAGGRRMAVDLAEVNGERFVNNASVGFYAALVRERHRHERRLPRAAANLTAAWAQARKGHRFLVRVGGHRYRAWLVFVGNGCYGENLTELMNRQSLAQGQLDVRVLRADSPLARVRAVLAVLAGRTGTSRLLARSRTAEVEVELLHRRHVDVALDGEVVRLDPILRFRSLPESLTVLVPPEAEPRLDERPGEVSSAGRPGYRQTPP